MCFIKLLSIYVRAQRKAPEAAAVAPVPAALTADLMLHSVETTMAVSAVEPETSVPALSAVVTVPVLVLVPVPALVTGTCIPALLPETVAEMAAL